MPSPTHITTYASDALALLTSRYSKPRPDPAPPALTFEDEIVHWQTGTDSAYAITGTGLAGIERVIIPALTAARVWTMPTVPLDGMIVQLDDSNRALVSDGSTLSVTTSGGTDHFIIFGVDVGTAWKVAATLFFGSQATLVRHAATSTWELA